MDLCLLPLQGLLALAGLKQLINSDSDKIETEKTVQVLSNLLSDDCEYFTVQNEHDKNESSSEEMDVCQDQKLL